MHHPAVRAKIGAAHVRFVRGATTVLLLVALTGPGVVASSWQREYVVAPTAGAPASEADVAATRDILEARMVGLGAADVTADVGPEGRVVVSVPGALDDEVVARTLTIRGALEFVPIPPSLGAQVVPGDPVPVEMADVKALVTTADLEEVGVSYLTEFDEYVIDLQIAEPAALDFDAHANDHFGEQVAFVLDGVVLVTPTLFSSSYGGLAQISAGFDEAEAVSLAAVLIDGRVLPYPVEVVTASSGGAALANDVTTTGDEAAHPPVAASDLPGYPRELHDGRSLGEPTAPVVIEVWSDPQCAPCAAWSQRVEPLLVAGPIRDGVVRYRHRDFPFIGPESEDAAIAMRVAQDLGGRFWDYRGVLYANQSGQNEGGFSRERLADIAEVVGIDREIFLAGFDDPTHAAAVRAEYDVASEAGIAAVPTLFVDGEMLSAPDWETLSAAIADSLGD